MNTATWGYPRIQGALKNVGHRVGRSTSARIVKAAGVPPVPERPTSWQTFLRAHWGTVAEAFDIGIRIWRPIGRQHHADAGLALNQPTVIRGGQRGHDLKVARARARSTWCPDHRSARDANDPSTKSASIG
jgi:hypothetical protein